MDVVYRLGEATAQEIQEELADDLANATIRTMLRILEQKGHLSHRADGRRYIYSPVRSRDSEGTSALQRIVGVFYKGSIANAVTGLLGRENLELEDAELDELAALIEEVRRRKKK